MIKFDKQKEESPEVLLSIGRLIMLNKLDMLDLTNLAKNNRNNKIRFCSHGSPNDIIHEMFIIHKKDTYIRPHKHINKIESMLVISGEVDYIVFDEIGNIEKTIKMGDFNSNKEFYVSIKNEKYHSMLIKSDWLIFLEITKGPLRKEDSCFAYWSPKEHEVDEIKIFIDNLKK